MNAPNLNLGLMAGKVAIFLGAVGLDLAGHLSPALGTLAATALVSLAGVHVAQLVGTQAASAPAKSAADLLQAALDAAKRAEAKSATPVTP